ncbi:arginyl-tRNA--protein transferase 1 isoform X2 [Fundulus heteroclitus]|uniref:arginyl-tRNA--protein transferase 1 isoform X2 n=1 Tax=Fundulus heteroclitus TaxID=8078 RepID=UPI00165A3F16|nr:arginyl-tRNA--protein transferase 1 isoform X2 [Fundulus heteroclitus]
MAGNNSYTIVEYFGGDDGYRCGYCKNEKGNFSHGMWSHTMTVQDYQDLIDRGWRRSGKYVYKPIMKKTCCPQYTIRCHALKFQPSKSHKKVLKKMSKFISSGELPAAQEGGKNIFLECTGKKISKCMKSVVTGAVTAREPMDSVCEEAGPREPANVCQSDVKRVAIADIKQEVPNCAAVADVEKNAADSAAASSKNSPDDSASASDGRAAAKAPKPGLGADPSRPLCRKAKDLRKERRLQKDQNRQHGDGASPPKPACTNQPKTLEGLMSEPLEGSSSRRLEVRLVPVNFDDPQFAASYQHSAALYARYQMAVHGDDPSECSETEFRRFLCDSPLEAEHSPDGPELGYGSFHQQYWLDGRIVAVGVIDILPTCVSSVYLYYHPDFESLSLGSYSALREIAFTRQLQKQSPKLCYYYLGFYIHSCPKMRYKGQYRPADLLCPETYAWVSIERCVPLLDSSRYARLNQDPDAGDARALKDVGRALVLHRRAVMPYVVYSLKRKGPSDEAEVKQYASLVGQDCAERILLYRS